MRFEIGDMVWLRINIPEYGLRVGDRGEVTEVYPILVPVYDVLFSGQHGTPTITVTVESYQITKEVVRATFPV